MGVINVCHLIQFCFHHLANVLKGQAQTLMKKWKKESVIILFRNNWYLKLVLFIGIVVFPSYLFVWWRSSLWYIVPAECRKKLQWPQGSEHQCMSVCSFSPWMFLFELQNSLRSKLANSLSASPFLLLRDERPEGSLNRDRNKHPFTAAMTRCFESSQWGFHACGCPPDTVSLFLWTDAPSHPHLRDPQVFHFHSWCYAASAST